MESWIADVKENHGDDLSKLGLAAFAENKFQEAAELFHEYGKWNEAQLEEIREKREGLAEEEARVRAETSRAFRLEGNAHYHGYRFDRAVGAYRRALEYMSREESPQLWAATSVDLGNGLQSLGIRAGGESSDVLLMESIAVYRSVLEVFTREALSQDWAMTQNNLGAALQEQGIRTGGEAGADLLGQAVEAYRAALQVFTREHLPGRWVIAMRNLELALRAAGRLEEAAVVEQELTSFENE